MRRWKGLSRVVLATLASAVLCGWTPKPLQIAIRSIGVIAAVGDTCMFERAPRSRAEWISPPAASFLEISDWGLDDNVTKAIATQLGSHYRVQSIAIEHQDFDTWTYETLVQHIRELPVPEIPVDAYLLVLRDWRRDDIGGSVHQVGGLGLYRRDLSGGERLGVFASYRLVLMESDRGRIIASRPALLQNRGLPWLPASSALWPRTQNDLSMTQRRILQDDLLRLIDDTLRGTLGELGLRT